MIAYWLQRRITNDFVRWLVLFVVCLAGLTHSVTAEAVPNTPLGMAAFHGCAALIDLMLLVLVSCTVEGKLRAHVQLLFFASVAGNIVGWLLYVSYVSPVYYNGFMWLLTFLQVARLLFVCKGDVEEVIGGALVRPPAAEAEA